MLSHTLHILSDVLIEALRNQQNLINTVPVN